MCNVITYLLMLSRNSANDTYCLIKCHLKMWCGYLLSCSEQFWLDMWSSAQEQGHLMWALIHWERDLSPGQVPKALWQRSGFLGQLGSLKWVSSFFAACGNKVDPVYEALRFGTSLAQRTKKGSSGSGSDSPPRTSVFDLVFCSVKLSGWEGEEVAQLSKY